MPNRQIGIVEPRAHDISCPSDFAGKSCSTTIHWGVLAVAIVAGLLLFRKDNASISSILKEQAARRNGVVRKVFGSYPVLSFSLGEVEIHVSAMHGQNGPFTYARFQTAGFPKRFCFRITSRSMGTKVMETRLDLKKIAVGQPEFDQKFSVRAIDESCIRSLLSTDIQKQLIELNGGMGIEVRYLDTKAVPGFRFDLMVKRLATDLETYEELIEATIAFHDRLVVLV